MRFVRRAIRHAQWRLERATTHVADRMRRGDRTVIMTPPIGLRFGNWMYLWLDAHARTAAGSPTLVLITPGMEPWLKAFPSLRALSISRDHVRFHDRREWSDRSWNQKFGDEFSRETLNAFITEMIVPFVAPDLSDRIVINVRRGDYYSNPELTPRYGFDQLGYLAEAVAHFEPGAQALIVSDDIEWCRENLDQVVREFSHVEYAEPGALSNFLAVAGARRLIGSNSTFSYWGGYIAGVLHRDAQIVMPRFHARLADQSDAYQLDPDWTIISGFD